MIKKGLVTGVNIVDMGPQGPRWPIHGPSPQVRWVRRRKGAFTVLRECIWSLVLLSYLFDSEVFKMKNRKYTIVLMTPGTYKKRYRHTFSLVTYCGAQMF